MFVDNAKQIASKSFSMWMNYLGIALILFSELRYYFFEIDSNPQVVLFGGVGLIILGTFGRLVNQGLSNAGKRSKGLSKIVWLILLAIFTFVLVGVVEPQPRQPFKSTDQHVKLIAEPKIALKVMSEPQSPPVKPLTPSLSADPFYDVALPLIKRWEGKRNKAYFDIVGVPTICYGHTRTVTAADVRNGVTWSDARCTALLKEEVSEYREGLHGYFTISTIAERLTAERDAAYTSLAYNVGIRGAGKSTATRRLNAGDIAGGCKALTWWNKAGGRVVRGLQNRRSEEYALCLA